MKLAPTLSALLSLLALSSSAFSKNSQVVSVEDPWVRSVPKVSKNTAGFMRLKNLSDSPLQLVRVESSISDKVELHTHTKFPDGSMKMEAVPSIDLPPGTEVELKPMGLHVMFLGVKNRFRKAQSLVMTLHFSDGSRRRVTAPIRGALHQEGNKEDHEHTH